MKITNQIAIVSVFFFLTLAQTIFAQNTWIGGTPGSETDWNNPRNWSLNHVPDNGDLVVLIADVSTQSGFFPVIAQDVPEIAFLNIEGGAKVTILTKGKLVVNGNSTFNHGIQNTGKMYNSGVLVIKNTALSPLAEFNNNIQNTGIFALENLEPNENIAFN